MYKCLPEKVNIPGIFFCSLLREITNVVFSKKSFSWMIDHFVNNFTVSL